MDLKRLYVSGPSDMITAISAKCAITGDFSVEMESNLDYDATLINDSCL